MCSGPKRKLENESLEGCHCDFSVLLELSASNDLTGFKAAIEEDGHEVDKPGLWYGRGIGSKKMGFEERTPLMIAALFGSSDVLSYILETGRADVNRRCGSDGATALHCAAAGGSSSSPEVVKLLLDASADPSSLDSKGNQPGDLIARPANSVSSPRRKALEIMLKGANSGEESCVVAHGASEVEELEQEILTPRASKDGAEKKEYPVDLTLPDIKNGIYGTDEFRMYTFKVKPCSRAYSHDWTECPFVHPGENARRRDPRKYHYSCVPCPEFRKGSCRQGDACEYAHGIFECWLHPAQYRTRLCKDEIGCNRRVCFFAHRPEELRPLYASTGSAVPSPRSYSASGQALDMCSISPLNLGSPSGGFMPPTSTPPLTPTGSSSPMGGWLNQSNINLPALQLPGSRLKSALCARDMDFDMELFSSLENRRRQQLMDEMSGIHSPPSWNNGLPSPFAASSGDRLGEMNRLGGVKPTNLEDVFGSYDPASLSQLHGLSMDAALPQMQSPTGIQIRQNINQQLRSSYPASYSSSPVRTSTTFGMDQPGAAANAAAVLSSRSTAFAKRSQSFIERTAVNRHSGCSSPRSSATMTPSNFSNWGSPDGKLDWGIQGEELHKLRKSASFGFRSNGSVEAVSTSMPADRGPMRPGQPGFEEQQPQCHLSIGGTEALPAWVEQLYMEQEQLVV